MRLGMEAAGRTALLKREARLPRSCRRQNVPAFCAHALSGLFPGLWIAVLKGAVNSGAHYRAQLGCFYVGRPPAARETDCWFALAASKMFATLMMTILDDVNTINTWAEPHNANGVTPNTVIDSNDEPPCNNQQRMTIRAY